MLEILKTNSMTYPKNLFEIVKDETIFLPLFSIKIKKLILKAMFSLLQSKSCNT